MGSSIITNYLAFHVCLKHGLRPEPESVTFRFHFCLQSDPLTWKQSTDPHIQEVISEAGLWTDVETGPRSGITTSIWREWPCGNILEMDWLGWGLLEMPQQAPRSSESTQIHFPLPSSICQKINEIYSFLINPNSKPYNSQSKIMKETWTISDKRACQMWFRQ